MKGHCRTMEKPWKGLEKHEEACGICEQLFSSLLCSISQVLAYEMLRRQLDISNLRQLEDFLITDCFYAGKWVACAEHLLHVILFVLPPLLLDVHVT